MSSISTISAAAMVNQEISGVVVTGVSTTEVTKIQDPYEQCLAYVKLKQIEGVDCKAKVAAIQNMRGTAILNETGSTQPKPPVVPKPPMRDGISLSEINQIKNPYEQCLAYVKFKKIEGVNCKARIDAIKNTISMGGTGTTGTGMRIKPLECMAPGSCGQGLPPIKD